MSNGLNPSNQSAREAASGRTDVCLNCGAEVKGAYCAACGQKSGYERNTVRSLARNSLGRVLNIEEGLLHTALALATGPGRAVREYVAGRTKRYSQPLSYLLICCALFAVVNQVAGAFIGGGSENKVFSMLLIPCIAAASRVLFWRYKWNYAEHLILGMYLFGQVVLYLTVIVALSAAVAPRTLHGSAPLVLGGIVVLLTSYVSWGYAAVFDRNRVGAALAGLLAVLAGTAIWLIALAVLVSALRAIQ